MPDAGQKSKWGSDYLNQGIGLCNKIHDKLINPQSNMPLLGDWSYGEQQVYNDVDIAKNFPHGRKNASRSTDWMLAHFATFKQVLACMNAPVCTRQPCSILTHM